jgi:DNA repair exonuclease SbcCD ATPase subunit
LRRENERLRRELERVRQELAEKAEQLAGQQKQLAERQKQIADREKQIRDLERQTGGLSAQLHQLLQTTLVGRIGGSTARPRAAEEESAQSRGPAGSSRPSPAAGACQSCRQSTAGAAV